MDLEFLRRLDALRREREDAIRSTNPVLYNSMRGLEHARTNADAWPQDVWLAIAAFLSPLVVLVFFALRSQPAAGVTKNKKPEQAPSDFGAQRGVELASPAPELPNVQGWWGNASRGTRAWIFVSAAWFLAVLVVVFVFDPMDYHDLSPYRPKGFFARFTGGDFVQLSVVCLLPPLAWAVHRLWLKLVVGPASNP